MRYGCPKCYLTDGSNICLPFSNKIKTCNAKNHLTDRHITKIYELASWYFRSEIP